MDNAQLTLPHESIGMSPFQLLYGYSPRKSFDWRAPRKPENAREKLAVEGAVAMARRMHDTWEWAKLKQAEAQSKKARDVNAHRREPDFGVKDMVWLSTKGLSLDRPSTKLGHKQIGPFKILEKIGYSYRLELPDSMKIHPVFHAKLLGKDPGTTLPGQVNLAPEPVNISGEDEWEVDSIRAVRKHGRKLRYRANWLGADEDPTYYDASNFKYSPHLLRTFHLDHPELPGPPAKLYEWIKAWEEGREDYDELDDDKAMDYSSRSSFFRRGG